MMNANRIALPPPRWMASPSADPVLRPAPAATLPDGGASADRAATARGGGPRAESAPRHGVPANDAGGDPQGEADRKRPSGGVQLPFLAQQIAQERLSAGLHREPWDVGPLAYRRAGAAPPLTAPAQSLDLAV